MENYNLREDEVILFRGAVAVSSFWKKEAKPTSYDTNLILTNLNIVLISDTLQTYSVEDIKIFNKAVQVIKKKKTVEIYHKTAELLLEFQHDKDAKEFSDKAIKLCGGESKFSRTMHKAMETFDLDINKIAKSTASAARDAMVGYVSGGSQGNGLAAKLGAALKSNQQKAKEEKKQLAAAKKDNK